MTVQTRAIEYEHNGTTLEGVLAFDDAQSGQRPGILVSHAWAGRTDFEVDAAKKLAALGYTAFALDLYGKGVVGSSVEENTKLMSPFMEDRAMLRDRLKTALTTMQSQNEVIADQCAIMGYCFGGLCALDLARSGAAINAAVSFHGLFFPAEGLPNSTISAKILALHGWDDPMAKPDSVLAFAQEMSEAGADWQLHAYGGVLHSFTNPAANDRDFGTVYDAGADARSWQAMTNFMAECLA